MNKATESQPGRGPAVRSCGGRSAGIAAAPTAVGGLHVVGDGVAPARRAPAAAPACLAVLLGRAAAACGEDADWRTYDFEPSGRSGASASSPARRCAAADSVGRRRSTARCSPQPPVVVFRGDRGH